MAVSVVLSIESPSLALRTAWREERAFTERFMATADPAASSAAEVMRSPLETRPNTLFRAV
jgi:hypothetical protein